MERFLKRFLLFATTALVVVITYHAAIYEGLLSDTARDRLGAPVTTVVLGDSHTETAVNDALAGSIHNLSYKGESPFYTYYKLNRLLDANAGIERVVLSFSYHSLNDFLDGLTDQQIHNYYWLMDETGYRHAVHSLSIALVVLRDMSSKLYDWVKSVLTGRQARFMNGGYRRLSGSNLSEGSTRDRIKWHFLADPDGFQAISAFQKQYFDKIIQLCVDNDVKVALLNTPLHPSYVEQVPARYTRFYHETVAELMSRYPHHVETHNLESLIAESRYFYDGDHLNAEGSDRFTRHLLNEVIAPANASARR